MARVVDVRDLESEEPVRYIFDSFEDYVYRDCGAIKLYSKFSKTEFDLTQDDEDSVKNFCLAVKMAAGITKDLGL